MQANLSKAEWLKCSAVLAAGTGKKLDANAMDVWYECLMDIPASVLKAACIRALQECETGFLPAIGLIRRLAAEAACGLLPQASHEWETVRLAVKRFGYMRKSEAMASLSPLTRQAVESVGWDAICDSENISIQAAQFRMAYEAAAKREADLRKISPELRPAITSSGEHVTPRLHQGPSAIVTDLAKRLSAPDEGAA